MVDRGRKLILVRHSVPEMVTGRPASQWHLSAEGGRRCETLAGRLAEYEPGIVVASEEPKAVETGRIVAAVLGLPFETEVGLHEHERGVVQDLESREDFQAQVARFFAHPDRLVFGRETAGQAHARFASAVARVLAGYPLGNVAIVGHGTVMALFVARANRFDPFPFWEGLGLPAFAVLSVPGFEMLQVVRRIAADPIP